GQPTIARFHDGDWYMIFGNGYDSVNGDAVLYMYNINTKTLLKFDTKVGTSGVSGTTTSNGMSTPVPVDYNGDRVTDAIYAGDLQGNLWKVDVSSSDPANWKFALTTSGNPTPLFTATDSSNNAQPITDRPQVGLDSSGRVMVYFGTGTYYQVGDNAVPNNPPVQSFYGIVDNQSGSSSNVVTRSELLQQSIIGTATVNGTTYRITSDNKMTSGQMGWYMDLDYPSADGERVVSPGILTGGRIIFTTVIPQGDACEYGGTSWLMELDSSTGSRLTTESPFDLNGDNKVDSSDLVTITNSDGTTSQVAVGGKQSNVGIIQTPGIITAGQLQYKYYSGSTGKIGETVESASSDQGGRLSWQQLLPKQ
ncbi:MAG TPA: PilC/PilY family type IV pilus protein, partial [Gammaproteobacteria bacterium]|nr:PilC/PilY family type IV pilus protein [Gammaproteobacteria bacterium]